MSSSSSCTLCISLTKEEAMTKGEAEEDEYINGRVKEDGIESNHRQECGVRSEKREGHMKEDA